VRNSEFGLAGDPAPGRSARRDGLAAVDTPCDAGDVGGIVGQEEGHGCGDLLGSALTAKGDCRHRSGLCRLLAAEEVHVGPLNGVSTHPGQMQFTRMPSGANSTAATFTNETTAPLAAAYAASPSPPISPDVDETEVIAPPPARLRGPAACLATKKAPEAFTAIERFRSSRLVPRAGPWAGIRRSRRRREAVVRSRLAWL
jgi:hypothetical protein